MAYWHTDSLVAGVASAFGLPDDSRLPQLATGSPGPSAGMVECGLCGPERADTRVCKRVAALILLQASPIEWVRRGALGLLAELGPGVASVLRELRRARRPGWAAALELLA
jgi:hypothetical protein